MASINFEYAPGSDRVFTWPNVTGTVAVPTFVNLTDGATITVPWVPNSQNYVQLGGNRTIAFSGTPSPSDSLSLFIRQDGTGSRTLTWPTSGIDIRWPLGEEPILTTAASRMDIIELTCFDGTAGALVLYVKNMIFNAY